MRNVSKSRGVSRNAMYARKRRNKFKSPFLLILFMLLCVIAWFVGAYAATGLRQEPPQFVDYFTQAAAPTQKLPSATHATQTDMQTLTFGQLIELSNNHLLLVNNRHRVPYGLIGELAPVIDYVWTLNANILMNRDALEMLSKMFASAANAGHRAFRVTEGYRTHEQQRFLYDTAADSTFVATPGYSEHQTGLAADISYHGVNIANSEEGAWLMRNSYRYGFVLRYPKHKTHITGLPFEPWHYRFVGLPHAYFMHRNDLVLEEYIDHLRRHGKISISLGGVDYTVFYLANPGESIEVPVDYSFMASLDNTGGIIVTAWSAANGGAE